MSSGLAARGSIVGVVTNDTTPSVVGNTTNLPFNYECSVQLGHTGTSQPMNGVSHTSKENLKTSWTSVTSKIKKKKLFNHTSQFHSTPDSFEYNSSLLDDRKQANTACFSLHHEGRRNLKESNRLRRKHFQPHGLEDDFPAMHSGPGGNDPSLARASFAPLLSTIEEAPPSPDTHFESSTPVDDSPPPPLPSVKEERNELVRLAATTPAQSLDTSGSEDLANMLKSISDIACAETTPEMDCWVSHLENLVIMSYQVSRAQSFTDVFVAVVAYIKMNTNKSILKQIFQLIDEVTATCPNKDVSPHAWESNDVLQNWDLFKNNTVFTKISYLLSAAMSLSVCSIKQIEWSPFGLQLIAVEAAKQQLKAVDVIDAVISTFTWFAETGYRVFQEKSLMPLLYSDNRMKQFNEDCDWVLANSEAALAGNLGEINDFEFKVDEVTRQVCEMKKVKDTGPTALWLQKRFSELVSIKHRIISKHKNTAIRFAPFGVGITGPSGVGKSTLSKLVMKIALNAMGFETDPKRIITKDMFDAYDSTYTSDILGMFMDDVGNGKAEFAKVSPTDIIIKFFNNMAAQAVKAELSAKGVVFIAFKVGVLTSNFADYNVRLFSCKPEASLRRFVHTRTRIKPEYRKPNSISLNTEHPDLCDSDLTQDVWELDLEECRVYETKTGKEAYEFNFMDVKLDDGRTIHCENLDLSTYVDVIINLAQRHCKVQKSVMKRSNDFDTMAMCQTCFRPAPMCKCEIKPHGVEQLGEVIVDAATSAMTSYINKWLSPVKFLNSMLGYKPVKNMATRQLAGEMKHVLNETCTPWMIAITPEWLFKTSVFTRSIDLWQKSAAAYDLRKQVRFGLYLGAGMTGLGLIRKSKSMVGLAIGSTWIGSMVYWSQYRARIRHYKDEYMQRRDALPDFAKSTRDGKIVKGAFVVSTLVVGLKLFRMWNQARIASLNPNALTPSDVDNQPSWFGFMMKKMGMQVDTSSAMRHVSSAQLLSAFQKNNLFWATFTRSDGSTIRCNIFFPRKCVAWFPHHVFFPKSDMTGTPTDLLSVVVERHERAGGVFSFKCELSTSVISDAHDMVCVYVPNCPDLKNRINWLPLSKPTGNALCNILVRKEEKFFKERLSVQFGDTGHKYMTFHGGTYTSKLAQNGACMGLLLLEAKIPTIVGFHIGGHAETNLGVMQTVTQDEAYSLISQLENIPGVLLSANATDIPATQFGKPLIISDQVHPHCMAAKLGKDAYIDVLGSTRLRMEQKSGVKQSIISDTVSEVTGVKNTWGAPKLKPNWSAYNKTLEHIVNPADMFVPSHVERARQDWLSVLLPLVESFSPLTDKESIIGVPGVRFLDALPMTTGMGFPIFGKKSPHFEDVHVNGMLVERIPSPLVATEITRIRNCWLRGERAYPVCSANLKDEPTDLEKDKVRVFQAGPVALSTQIRKYFLPVARFLSLHPCESESAVGVNAFSPQWQELMAHANKYAEDKKVIAWDYSKYDVRMNSQITRAVFMCFIDIAQKAGYSHADLAIMKAMVSDIVHPLIDYNGTMIMAYNMNTSGNNMTVNVNSTAGSLYVRLGFFNEYPKEREFRKSVAALVYGDDFKGSVHKNFRKFNFITYKTFLAGHGMKITLPDKGENEVAFMQDDDADFLKRQTNIIPEINCGIGRLDEMSIFKSLHSNLKSKTASPVEVSASCIETAMHEWFAHGKDVYDLRRTQMMRVCEDTNIPVPAVNVTFEERAEHWLSKYN